MTPIRFCILIHRCIIVLAFVCLTIQPSQAAEPWQVVITGHKTPDSAAQLSLYSDIDAIITQGFTRVLSAANIAVYPARELGLSVCEFDNCASLKDDLRRAIRQSANNAELALIYQFEAFQQRQNTVTSWQFSLNAEVVDINSGIQLDSFSHSTRADSPGPHCIAQCSDHWLNQSLDFLSQELASVLAEKITALPRRYVYQLQFHDFPLAELHTIHAYLQALDGYVSDELQSEYDTKRQWLHQLASQDYRYVSALSSTELGSSLSKFFDQQAIQSTIRYQQSKQTFVVTRSGWPYLSRYVAGAGLVLLCLLVMWQVLKRQGSRPKARSNNHSSSPTSPNEVANSQTTKSRTQSLILICLLLIAGLIWQVQYGADERPAQGQSEPTATIAEPPTQPSASPLDPARQAEAERQQQDNNDWQLASTLNSEQSYQLYLQRWPQGRHLIAASAALKTKQDDKLAWQTADKQGTQQAYQDYLAHHPDGDYHQRARQNLTQLMQQQRQTQQRQDLMALADDYYYRQKDYAEARYYYTQAAAFNDARAQYQLAQIFAEAQGIAADQRVASKWYQLAAEQGHAQAQFNLAYRYTKGLGLSTDNQRALYWYQQAAQQGVVLAQYNLAYHYAQGTLGVRDFNKAAYWYQHAAEQGDADAQNNLGKLYENGQGVRQDHDKARMLYRLAAAQGHQVAKINLSLLNP